MSNSREFQRAFQELTEDMDCKRSQIPKILGIEYGVFTAIMDYGKIPKPVVLMRIADYFNVSIEYLLGRTEQEYFEKAEHPTTFHERFKQLRERYQMTEYAVAQRLHISTSYTTAWRKKNYIPSLDNLTVLSEIFKTSIDYLLGRTDDM